MCCWEFHAICTFISRDYTQLSQLSLIVDSDDMIIASQMKHYRTKISAR